jgi:hypothetical protein
MASRRDGERKLCLDARRTGRKGKLFRVVHVWEKRGGKWFLSVDQVTGVN